MTPEQRQALTERLLAMQPQPPEPRRFRIDSDGYLLSVGIGPGGTELTGAEYDEILAVIGGKPAAPEGYDYRLRTNLTWELCERPAPPEEGELDPAQALEMICGKSSLTRTEALRFQADLKTAREEAKEKREE